MNTPTLRSSTATEKASEGFACRSSHRKISVRAPAPQNRRWYSACRFQARWKTPAPTQAYRESESPRAFRKARARNRGIQNAPREGAAEFVVQGRANPQGEDSRV